MNTSWLTQQHLLYAVPVVVVVGLLLLQMLIRLAVIVAVVGGVGLLVLRPTGTHLPPDLQRTLHDLSRSVLHCWQYVRGLTG